MSKWTIQAQENIVKAAILSSGFLAALSGLYLAQDILLHWFGLVRVSAAVELLVVIPLFYVLKQIHQQPVILSYGWRLQELYGDHLEEYLRSRYQRATALGFQLMILTGFFGYVLAHLILAHGDPAWISHKMVPFLTLFVGNLSFYLSLRHVLDDNDAAAEQ